MMEGTRSAGVLSAAMVEELQCAVCLDTLHRGVVAVRQAPSELPCLNCHQMAFVLLPSPSSHTQPASSRLRPPPKQALFRRPPVAPLLLSTASG